MLFDKVPYVRLSVLHIQDLNYNEKHLIQNILQFYPIVNFNAARVTKQTKVVEVFFKLLVFGMSKSCFHE